MKEDAQAASPTFQYHVGASAHNNTVSFLGCLAHDLSLCLKNGVGRSEGLLGVTVHLAGQVVEQSAGDFFLPLGYKFLGIAGGTCRHLDDFPIIEGETKLLGQGLADIVAAAAILPVNDYAYGLFRRCRILLGGFGFTKQHSR